LNLVSSPYFISRCLEDFFNFTAIYKNLKK
jgi:hypothetical protein